MTRNKLKSIIARRQVVIVSAFSAVEIYAFANSRNAINWLHRHGMKKIYGSPGFWSSTGKKYDEPEFVMDALWVN